MKEWLKEGGVSTDSAIVSDGDTMVQRENMFSDADCEPYHYDYGFRDVCDHNPMLYVTFQESLSLFAVCITRYFMTKMGARNSCSGDSVRSDTDTTVKNTTTLLLKDLLFYNSLVDTLDAGSICQAMNDTVTIADYNCASYIIFLRKYHAGSKCVYNSHRIDIGGELSYKSCLYYRLMKSLGAESDCQISLMKHCDWYYNMVQSLAPTCIYVSLV